MKLKVLHELTFWDIPWELQKERLGLDDNRLVGQSVDDISDSTNRSSNQVPKVGQIGEMRERL
ncbi:MAG: hypothetical protein KAR39_08790 [Thermoplasmata archaeon]|nr:hypothetical protein [Thermoplasmata archaeon]